MASSKGRSIESGFPFLPSGLVPDGLFGAPCKLLGGLRERLSSCLDTYGVYPATTVVQLPALRLHLFLVQTAAAQLGSPVREVSRELARAVVTDAVTVKESRAGEVVSASGTAVGRRTRPVSGHGDSFLGGMGLTLVGRASELLLGQALSARRRWTRVTTGAHVILLTMDWREIVARVLPEAVWRFLFDRHPKPHPEPRILGLVSTGGGTHVTFRAEIANEGTQRCRCEVLATVGQSTVQCQPPTIDLLANAPTEQVSIHVPRPELGDLVPEFNNEASLYGETLRVALILDGEEMTSEEWHEQVYDIEENRERHGIQQRIWRRGRGEETEGDLRMEAILKHEQKIDDR
jgi:hypothetical protein